MSRQTRGITTRANDASEVLLSSTITYTVNGMSCGHCEKSVSSEVSAIPGVTEVAANAKAGTVTISSEPPVDVEKVRAAVDEAGYELVGPAA